MISNVAVSTPSVVRAAITFAAVSLTNEIVSRSFVAPAALVTITSELEVVP